MHDSSTLHPPSWRGRPFVNRTVFLFMIGALLAVAGRANAQAAIGGESTYPRNDAESRAAARARAARPAEVIKITRNSRPGGIVARGRRLATRDGAPSSDAVPCEFN